MSARGIHQTPFGRVLCWLGVHQVIVANRYSDSWNNGHGSAIGGCVRCNEPFQWDF